MNDVTHETPNVKTISDEEDFFVGYLPVPSRLSMWLKRTTAALAAMVVITAAVIAALQTDPGDAAWTLDQVESWQGALIARPYPMLIVQQPDGQKRTYLLVSEGKQGAVHRLPQYDCDQVRVKGTLLHRDGRHMIELLSTDDGFELLSGDAPPEDLRITPALAWNQVELRGEIIDPKCYLGAMKPGRGKTHKACAALCLRGGIPPMFVSDDMAGRRMYYLLVLDGRDPAEGAALETFISHVGDAVKIKGEAAMWGDVVLLKVNPRNVARE